jgi:NADH:ubiquinone oxidoreductase subunit B-like Fe-S oxidoreductase
MVTERSRERWVVLFISSCSNKKGYFFENYSVIEQVKMNLQKHFLKI